MTITKPLPLSSSPLTVVDRGLGDISDGGRLDNVSHDKLLDRLILGHASGAVGASDSLHVAAALLASSSVSSLGSLRCQGEKGR